MSQRTSRDSGPRMHFGAPPAKSKDFKGTLQRLINEFGDERKTLYIVFFLITAGVTIGAFGPKLLGRATNYLFYGFIGKKLPAGLSKEQVVEQLRTSGQNRFADLIQASDVVPGQGINFTAIKEVIIWVLVLYLVSSLFLLSFIFRKKHNKM